MPAYRFYRLDGAGKIVTADWIAADSDEQALARAQETAQNGRFELWDRKRLVGRGSDDGKPG